MMEYHANGKSFKFTKPMTAHIEKEVGQLNKYLNNLDGRSVLKKEGSLLVLEIEVGGVRASAVGEDFYDLTKAVVAKLVRQITKSKSIRKETPSKNKNIKNFVSEDYDDTDDLIKREKFLLAEEMSDQEAIEQLELLGHEFFIYRDIDRKTICTIYKRKNGGYGLINVK
jgi:putative sigma-54 modulation protein